MLTLMKLQHPFELVVRRIDAYAKTAQHIGVAAAVALTSSVAHAEDHPPADPPAATSPSAGPLPALPASTPEYTASPVPSPEGQDPSTAEPDHPSAYDIATDTDPSALTTFREPLAPYGTWEDDATYGVVWVPHRTIVGADFAPYVSHGHWGLGVDNSWVWVSDFNWGWAPFHYGRWVWVGGRGWAWIPGRVYAPAWVVWRTGMYDDYYVGWAPMPPTWYWRGGYAYSLWRVPMAPYVFCSASYVFSPHVRSYIAPPGRVAMIAPRTRPYVAASGGVTAASYRTAALTRGPNPGDAHIPAGAVPSSRVSTDPRAAAFARPAAGGMRSFAGSSAGINAGAMGQRSFDERPSFRGPSGVARPGLTGGAAPGATQPLRPFPSTPQTALPSTPSMRPFTGPSEIPRPSARPAPSSGGSLRPMAPPTFGSGGSGGSLRPMSPPSVGRPGGGFNGGAGMRPMNPGGGGGFRPRAR